MIDKLLSFVITEQDDHENPANHDGYSLDDDMEL